MEDRNYHYSTNQYNSYTEQSYGYSQRQPQNQQLSHLFDMRSSQSSGFSVNTSMPTYNSGPSYQTQNSAMGYDSRTPQSRSDTLSRADSNKGYSPAWNYVDGNGGEKHTPQNRSFANLFDLPEQKGSDPKSSEWSNDNFSPPQSYQRDSQVGFNLHDNFSQYPSSNFSSGYNQSDYRFSQSDVPKQSSNFKQNNNRGFGKKGRGVGGFRGRGGRGGRGRGRFREFSGSWQGHDRVGQKKSNNFEDQNPKVVEDKIESEDMGEHEVDYNEEMQGSEEEGNETNGGQEQLEKANVFIPSPDTVMKYEYYPPSPEEMGSMFKDLVIYFFFKIPKNKKEQNPFVVICESFRRSAGYAHLEVEDGYDMNFKDRKFCTLRYNNIMMVRGVGENNCIKEPRVVAGVELINTLAMSCYTLEAKPEYFTVKGFENQQKEGGCPGVYRIVPEETAYDFATARYFLNDSPKDSDVEYMFKLKNNKEANRLKNWGNKSFQWDARIIKDTRVGICRHRTPQYWRDKILASGSMENAKFVLKPPQGIGNLLMSNFNVNEAVVQLKKRPFPLDCQLKNVYGPSGFGPNISKALPPWQKRGGNFRNKKTRQKSRKIMEEVAQGVPLIQAKGYKYLSQQKRKKLRKMLGVK